MRIPLTTPVDDGDTVRSGVTVDHIVIYPDKSIVINAKRDMRLYEGSILHSRR